MECLGAAVVLSAIVVVALTALGLGWPATGEESLKQVARRFGGVYYRGTWFQPTRVILRYGAASGVLRVVRQSSRVWLEIVIFGTRPGVRLEVAPTDDPALVKHTIHGATAHVTALPLDAVRPYGVYSAAPQEAGKFLTEAVKLQLKVLQRFGEASTLIVRVEAESITVRKAWDTSLRQSEPIITFVQATLRLHDHILLGKERGIEFVAPVQTPLEHVKCAVCGEPMGDSYVACRTCSAPHHIECWKYNGSCGMYACKELRYEAVRNTSQSQWPRSGQP